MLAILAAVVAIVTSPLWRERDRPESKRARSDATDLAELEAARDAKYREIRDAELDHRTGKLSDPDFEALDRSLRAEALEILNQLERVSGTAPS